MVSFNKNQCLELFRCEVTEQLHGMPRPGWVDVKEAEITYHIRVYGKP